MIGERIVVIENGRENEKKLRTCSRSMLQGAFNSEITVQFDKTVLISATKNA